VTKSLRREKMLGEVLATVMTEVTEGGRQPWILGKVMWGDKMSYWVSSGNTILTVLSPVQVVRAVSNQHISSTSHAQQGRINLQLKNLAGPVIVKL
jgi:hypothetical protein